MTAAALEEAIETKHSRCEKAILFSNKLESELRNMEITILGEGSRRIPHTTFFKIDDAMGPYLVSQLEAEGIYVGRGSACTSTSNTNSTVRALGMGGKASGFIRVSQWGNYSIREANTLVKAIKKYIK